jgi:hypothetical protein
MQQILDLAQQYDKDRTPPMVQRIEIGENLEQRLSTVLDDVAAPAGLADLDLRVHAGGDMGYISPFPWVRVYSDIYAHSAQNGIYLVYLFAADGSRVYLSLHQGTSVPSPAEERAPPPIRRVCSSAPPRREARSAITSRPKAQPRQR